MLAEPIALFLFTAAGNASEKKGNKRGNSGSTFSVDHLFPILLFPGIATTRSQLIIRKGKRAIGGGDSQILRQQQ